MSLTTMSAHNIPVSALLTDKCDPEQGIAIALKCGATKSQFDSTVCPSSFSSTSRKMELLRKFPSFSLDALAGSVMFNILCLGFLTQTLTILFLCIYLNLVFPFNLLFGSPPCICFDFTTTCWLSLQNEEKDQPEAYSFRFCFLAS